MFDNFLKWNTGKTNVKIIATILVITLTFANFAILGSYLTESIAKDNIQNNLTNADNVKFAVYLDEEDTSKTAEAADVNSEDITLYASVKVENEGSLEKAKINFANSNFKLKDSDKQEIEIGTIGVGEEKVIPLAIVARKDSNYNLNLLNMQSKVKLTGDYINSNQEVTPVDTTKEVQIKWNTDSISKEQITLSQEVITNKIFNIDGANKRVVQVLIKTNIEGNAAPVKSEKITIESSLSNEVAQSIKVTTLKTLATNGQNEIGFNNNVGSTYTFDSNNNIVTIALTNEADEQGNIAWPKNANDELIVTYIYEENVELTSYTSEVKANYEIYGSNNTFNKEVNYEVDGRLQELDQALEIKNAITKDIYKGNMYIGEETLYQTGYDVYLNYANIADNITVNDLGENKEGVNTKFVKTTINKEQALNILGEQGKIEIYNNLQNPEKLAEITLSEVEQDEITFEYQGEISTIQIVTSTPVNAGVLSIRNVKAILAPESNETISELQNIESKVELNNSKNSNAIANVLEPITTIEMSLEKESISNQTEDTLRITTVLKAVDSSNKLFVNPVLSINLPEEFEETEIVGVELVNGEELSIKTNKIENNVLTVELEGEQTKYTENTALGGANIVIDLKVKSQKFMADKNVELNATCINGEENAQANATLQIASKKGFVTSNSLTVDGTAQESQTATIKENAQIEINSKIINNFGSDLSNVTITPIIPEGLALVSNEETKIEKEIFAQGEMVEISYTLKAAEDLTQVEQLVNKITIDYELEEVQKPQEKIEYVFNVNKTIVDEQTQTRGTISQQQQTQPENYDVELSVTPKTTLNTLREGQIVTYVVSAKNAGDTVINNAVLEYTIPEGTTYTELTYSQGADIRFTDDENKNVQSWDINTLNAGETVSKEVTIKIKKGTASFVNNVKLSAQGMQDKTISSTVQVQNAELEVLLATRTNNEIPVDEGHKIIYTVVVKNVTSSTINDVIVKSNIPQNTVYSGTEDCYVESENAVYINIPKIESGEEEVVTFEVTVANLPQNISTATIENTVIVKTANQEEYESNTYVTNFVASRFNIKLESSNKEEIKEGETVKYTITATNIGTKDKTVTVIDKIPSIIRINSAKIYVENTLINEYTEFNNNEVNLTASLGAGETLKIDILGETYSLPDSQEEMNITNSAKLVVGGREYVSNSINSTIINEDWVEPAPVDPEKPDDPGKPDNPEEKYYSISGLVWLDVNGDGIRDNNEEILKNINVILLDEQGNIAKDKDGNNLETQTTITGTYKFNNLKSGNYVVAFVYDNDKYTITKYQVKEATEENNSDAIGKTIELDNQKQMIALTDVLKISSADIKNIDLGLVQNGKFDLRLNKYIEKIVVTNAGGTTTYNFQDETTLTKIDISQKYLNGSTIVIEYNLVITNEGTVDGYVEDLMDYIPKDLTFSSDLNADWYQDQSGNLHNGTLKQHAIKPGKTEKVKLVLTKTIQNQTGTIINTAEIGLSSNLQGLQEYDSVAGNNKEAEDDFGKAELIISIATGSPAMYVGIVIASLAVLGVGIYLINKKVLKGGNI